MRKSHLCDLPPARARWKRSFAISSRPGMAQRISRSASGVCRFATILAALIRWWAAAYPISNWSTERRQAACCATGGDSCWTSIQALANRWRERLAYVAADAKDRLGMRAILVRPDGIVAWACEAAPDHEEVAHAISRWFGETGRAGDSPRRRSSTACGRSSASQSES
ncbi:hypothetical protein EMIT0111MI5_80280 [Burkholderia sp. IT-111MI5]